MFEIYAYVERMKYIRRWALMRSFREENDMEHSFQVAYIAHAMALIRNELYGGTVNVGDVLAISLYHDLSETITGDMPTPIKYWSPQMQSIYKGLERSADEKLLATLPEPLRASYTACMIPNTDSEEYRIVKAADKLSAYLKCVEETKGGNTEFVRAMEGKKEELLALKRPEVTYFIEKILPVYELTLDELNL